MKIRKETLGAITACGAAITTADILVIVMLKGKEKKRKHEEYVMSHLSEYQDYLDVEANILVEKSRDDWKRNYESVFAKFDKLKEQYSDAMNKLKNYMDNDIQATKELRDRYFGNQENQNVN